MNRLQLYYNKIIIREFMTKYGFSNVMSVPKLKKIVINIGFGISGVNNKIISSILNELSLISGQKPIITKASKSIAGFKIRQGVPIGCKVTLRRNMMYDFFDKLLSVVLPRMRDFRGLSVNSFDGHGNYSLGIKEQILFPEINYDKVDIVRGMDITIVTSSLEDKHSKLLLQCFKFPFSK